MCKNGSWIKATSGDFGVYYKGGKPVRFECIGCMFAQGLLHPYERLQGAHLPQNFSSLPVMHRHDVEIHKQWLLAGKPVKRS